MSKGISRERIIDIMLRTLEDKGIYKEKESKIIGVDALIDELKVEERVSKYLEAHIGITLANYLSYVIISNIEIGMGSGTDLGFDLDEYLKALVNKDAMIMMKVDIDLRKLINLDELEPLLDGEELFSLRYEELEDDELEDEEIINLGNKEEKEDKEDKGDKDDI